MRVPTGPSAPIFSPVLSCGKGNMVNGQAEVRSCPWAPTGIHHDDPTRESSFAFGSSLVGGLSTSGVIAVPKSAVSYYNR